MAYYLGIDLGTTYTAAAAERARITSTGGLTCPGTVSGGTVSGGNVLWGAGIFGADGAHVYTPALSLTTASAFGSDALLVRDAAAQIAQRNGTNAQTFRWYRTFTDTSNYERGALQTAAGYVEVAAETAGTGTDNIDVRLTPAGTGSVFPQKRVLDGVTTLTDGANVTLNSSLGNVFKLVAGGSRTIDAPTNKPAAGQAQKIIIMHEASAADRTLTLATGSAGAFRFGTDITALTATTSGLVDYIGCVYNAGDDRWDVVSYTKGF